MKSEKSEGFISTSYGTFGGYYHRIDGPAYIVYETQKKQKIKFVEFILYDKRFFPWWLGER